MSDLFKPRPEEDRKYFLRVDSPKNWWKTVDAWWDELVDIIAHHMQLNHPAYETPGDSKSAPTGRTISEEILHLKEVRDSKLVRYFSAAWCMASDAYAYSVPGWSRLCELCSEEYLLYEDEMP